MNVVNVVNVGRMERVDVVRRGLGLGLLGLGENVQTIDRGGMDLVRDSISTSSNNIWFCTISEREETLTPWWW